MSTITLEFTMYRAERDDVNESDSGRLIALSRTQVQVYQHATQGHKDHYSMATFHSCHWSNSTIHFNDNLEVVSNELPIFIVWNVSI